MVNSKVSGIDEKIWEIFEADKKAQGFDISNEGISLNIEELKRARARGGFTIGQHVHKAAIKGWEGLTFDDITGSPYRALDSRDDADLTTEIVKGITLSMPLVSSNMECVSGYDMLVAMAKMGGLGIRHQFDDFQCQLDDIVRLKNTPINPVEIDGKIYNKPSLDKHGRLLVGAAIGVKQSNIEKVKKLVECGIDMIVVDIAHGHSEQMINMIKSIKDKYPSLPVIAGNVANAKGAMELCEAGADALKVGIGPGAACTTRIVTGYGVPQITAIYETSLVAATYGVKIMADGGVKESGDMVKALAARADTIMIGGLLSTTTESNNFTERIARYSPWIANPLMYFASTEFKEKMIDKGYANPRLIKYYGSASEESKTKQGRGCHDAPEGRTRNLEYTGNTYVQLSKWQTAMKSGISYSGRSRDPEKNEHANIQRLRTKSRWIRQTPSGIYEANKGNPKA